MRNMPLMILALAVFVVVALASPSPTAQTLHCAEDEVAVHGGLEYYYDPDAPLECAHLDDMFSRYWRQWGYDQTYDPSAPRLPWAQDWR